MHSSLHEVKELHIIGIGGSGASGLASILQSMGKKVSGSDLRKNEKTTQLEEKGITIFYGHAPENIIDTVEMVIASQAVASDNIEYRHALARKIPTLTYPEALGQLMDAKTGIAVAGTHGKSTTCALIVHLLKSAHYDPSFVIGGEIVGLGNSNAGQGPYLVAEACEYKRSFLYYKPEIAVITSIEEDHLDYYKDLEDIIQAFGSFISNIQPEGRLVACALDRNIRSLLENYSGRTITYGSHDADLQAHEIQMTETGNSFLCVQKGLPLGYAATKLFGPHNVMNALAAIGVALSLNIEWGKIAEALYTFPGIHRRFEIKAKVSGITIIDDYGHHPTEILTTLKAVHQRFPGQKLFVVFQPHQYSRTRFLLKDFSTVFQSADEVIVPEIYFVRDTELEKKLISSEVLVEEMQKKGTKAKHIASFEEIAGYLKSVVKPNDLLLTIGAGPIHQVGTIFEKALREE